MRYSWPKPCDDECAHFNHCHYPYTANCSRCGAEHLECELVDGLCDVCGDLPAEEEKEEEDEE